MTYLDKLMARNEKVVLMARQHWIVLLPQLLIDGVIALALVAATVVGAVALPPPARPFSPLLLILLVLPLVHFVNTYLQWWNEQYVVTNRRVMQIEGVFNKHVSDSSLEKVNDVVMEQSALGRLLNYGDIEIITGSDVGVNLLHRITNPIRFKTEMLNQKEAMGILSDVTDKTKRVLEGPAPSQGDIPELIAELDELRQKGVISEQEFLAKKAELLSRL